MDNEYMRKYIKSVISGRFSSVPEQRAEAVKDVLALAIRDIDEKALENFARLVPTIPTSLYDKWVDMFCDRLLETVQPEQIQDLCHNTEENRATLALVYIMFMESERMEKVIAEDLQNLGIALSAPEDGATILGAWLKSRITQTYQ